MTGRKAAPKYEGFYLEIISDHIIAFMQCCIEKYYGKNKRIYG